MAAISEATPLTLTVGATDCDFTAIQPALNAATAVIDRPVTIVIAAGTYHERIKITGRRIHVRGVGQVVITAAASAHQLHADGRENGTFRTATCFINGQQITLTHLTIANTAGAADTVGQAMALYCEGDQITVADCQLLGQQDTLCLGPLPPVQKDGSRFVTEPLRQRFHQQNYQFNHCHISGTVDFIFGGGQAQFNHCELLVLPREASRVAYVTAASSSADSTGFVFRRCQVQTTNDQRYYLGRPWRATAHTKFEQCWFDQGLLPAGWSDWQRPQNQRTVHYSEVQCHYQTKPVTRAAWIDYRP